MFASQPFDGASSGETVLLPTAAPNAQPARKDDAFSCLPVTIRMVENAASKRSVDGEIRFHGTQPDVLLLVGAVEAVSQSSASFEFSINDGTGRIRARWFANVAELPLDQLIPGKYVSIAAQLRSSPALHLSITTARVIRSADEISYHSIEAAHAALKLQRQAALPKATPDPLAITPSPRKHTPSALPLETTPPKTEELTPSTTHGGGEQAVQELETVHACPEKPVAIAFKGASLGPTIIRFLQQRGEGKEEGVGVADIVHGLASSASESDVRSALERLVGEGDVFNTIDDDHFQAM
eukprot:TRINITY_DN2346_c0_g1_i4.p1 TRINITY_DN2346_c0_g1~~TRINITY_DN2346_c0_g1_i4.p1  ORF type:complete len:297 (-),score=54.55 TRINITY_DN2346_c0_g1_i4:155-1045(-)